MDSFIVSYRGLTCWVKVWRFSIQSRWGWQTKSLFSFSVFLKQQHAHERTWDFGRLWCWIWKTTNKSFTV